MSCNKAITQRATIRAAALAAVLLGTVGLQACAHDPHPAQTAKTEALLPTEQFPIQVTDRPEQIALGLHGSGLSTTQMAALGQFVSEWRDDGGGAVILKAPNDGADPVMARRMEDQTAAYLVRLGVPRERLQIAGYVSGRAPGAPLLASYEKFEAKGPNCSGGWKNLTSTNSNAVYDHFGCSVTANVAAQIANPRDLLAPAVVTPADNPRREVVLGKYRRGEVTSSAQDTQADGKVSATQ
jgi:pilus assembly protein CpaD